MIGRHQRFAVDVWGTLRTLDNRKEMASQTTFDRESTSVASAPSGKCLQFSDGVNVSQLHLLDNDSKYKVRFRNFDK